MTYPRLDVWPNEVFGVPTTWYLIYIAVVPVLSFGVKYVICLRPFFVCVNTLLGYNF